MSAVNNYRNRENIKNKDTSNYNHKNSDNERHSLETKECDIVG